MPFKIDTQMKGVYVISEDSIAHYFFQKEETSPGLLVKKHYTEIERALFSAWYIREGKCYESIVAYWHEENLNSRDYSSSIFRSAICFD